MHCLFTEGTAITLQQMLEARELRAARQKSWLLLYQKPLISVTTVVPGAIKNSKGSRLLLQSAMQVLRMTLQAEDMPIKMIQQFRAKTGPEGMLAIDAEGMTLKRLCVAIEDGHPLGRLWDLDVICPGQGVISRRTLGVEGRRCLVCDEAAHACARTQRHDQTTLFAAMMEKMQCYAERDK